jgi:hypothetical protein
MKPTNRGIKTMLVYKAQQVISAQAIVSRDWEMPGKPGESNRKGTSIYSDLTVIGQDGSVAVIRVKGKSEDEVKAKIAKLTPGKPAEIIIRPDEQTRGVSMLTA